MSEAIIDATMQANSNVSVYIESPSVIVLHDDENKPIENINRLEKDTTRTFGKEDLRCIGIRDVALIFNDAKTLPVLMKYYMYELNSNNINFYKENINDKFVSVLIGPGKISKYEHHKFIHMVHVNILKHCVYILTMYSDDMTIVQLSKAMRVLDEFRKSLKQTEYLQKTVPCNAVFKIDDDVMD
jgi:hypothetical protein